MPKDKPQFNDSGEVFCLDCPEFYPDEAPCAHNLAGNGCPTKADFEQCEQWGPL